VVNCLALLVTTHCNRKCPECCFGILTAAPQHQSWSYFEEAARCLAEIHWLFVAGGEPTLHPEFPRIASEFRTLFDPEHMILTTNGARVIEHGDSMQYFDEVRITDFPDHHTQAVIAWMRQHAPDRLVVWGLDHIPMTHRGGPHPCDRRTIAAYAGGRLYPCCEGPGLPQASSIPLGSGWQADLERVPLSCAVCPFGRMEPLAPGGAA
jgi:hypothetical protein